MPAIAAEVEKRQVQVIAEHTNWTLTLDGWTDVSSNSIYAVMLMDGTTQHYLGNLDFHQSRHTADNILASLEELLGERVNYVKAIVTDSPAVMVKFRESYCKRNKGVVNLGCVLHVINLVCKDVIKLPTVLPTAQSLSRLVVFFSNSVYWRTVLENWGSENSVTKFLTKYVETRWYSFVSMCATAKSYTDGFKHCLHIYDSSDNVPEIPKDIQLIIRSDIFLKVSFLFNVLKPLVSAIAVLERRDAKLSEVWISFIKIHKYLRTVSRETLPEVYIKIAAHMVERLNFRAVKFTAPIYIVALFLTPQYRKICTSKKFMPAHVHYMATKLATKWKIIKTHADGETLKAQLEDYTENKKPHHANEKDPWKYWTELNSQQLLADLAKTIFSIIPSSASIERLFSKLKRAKTPYRNRMLVENLTVIGKIKLDALNNEEHAPTDIDVEEEMSWTFDPIDFDMDTDEVDYETVSMSTFKIDEYFDWAMEPYLEDSVIGAEAVQKINIAHLYPEIVDTMSCDEDTDTDDD